MAAYQTIRGTEFSCSNGCEHQRIVYEAHFRRLKVERMNADAHGTRTATARRPLTRSRSVAAPAPSKHENDSDDTAPVVTAIRMIARETGAAIVLLHHRGDSEKFFRGTTTIRDQSDAMLALWEDEQDLRLRCKGGGKMRYAPKPDDLWLAVDPFSGGVREAEPTGPPPKAPRRDALKARVLDVLSAPSMREVAAGSIARRTTTRL